MTEDGCWVFGTGTDRYPTVYDRVLRLAVHRLAHVLFVGPIVVGHVLHTCDNKRCWRPDHLYDGDSPRNNADRRARYTTYGRAGARNHFARLTEENVTTIKAAADERGMLTRARAREFAAEFGVHLNTVYRAFTGQTWREDTRTRPAPREHWAKRR